jgi:hypothetical protein
MTVCQLTEVWVKSRRKKYCEGDKTRCARYKVASSIGKQNVPLDLYPIMMEKANKIIKEYNRKKRN